jgi:kynurenine formamidase
VSVARRTFLLQLGVAATAALGCRSAKDALPIAPERAPLPLHLVDLTHTLSPSFPFIPVQNKTFPFRLSPIAQIDTDGVYANRWELTEHVGTHLDAPCHFAAGGAAVDGIPLESLVAPLAVLSFVERASRDPDAVLSIDEVRAWEKVYGQIPPGAAVFLHSGWQARAADAKRFVNLDAEGTMHFPGFSESVVELLLRERDIRGIGIDTLSIDPGRSAGYPVHKRLFAAGKWAVECLAQLDRVPPLGAMVMVAPVKVEGASGAPARVVAFW